MKLFSAISTLNAKRLTQRAKRQTLKAKRLTLVVSIFNSLILNQKSLITIVMLFTLSVLLLAIATPILAQPATGNNCVALPPDPDNPPTAADSMNQINDCAIESNVYDDKLFNFNQMAGTADSLYTMLLGYSALHPETNPVTGGTGATSAVNGMIASLYSRPPISGTYYVAQMTQKINPVQPALAQTVGPGGIGYSILEPVKEIWSAFRNAAYVGFVIIFVIIGFMIMFRRKISSQAVATIQDSLPRIVIALILVTFSYAIVGLIIDAMFVILNVIASLLETAGLTPTGREKIFTENIFQIVFKSMNGIFDSISEAIKNMLNDLLGKGSLGGTVGWIGGVIVGIITAIAVLMVSLRIFLMLLMSYVSIILLTLFAPFILLFEALPGNNSFNGWFKQIIANLSVFPTVAVMIMLAGLISGIGALGGSGTTRLGQDNIGNFPLLSGVFDAASIGNLIGLGLLLMTPTAAKIVKERLGVKEGALGAGAGAAMAGFGAGAVASRNIGKTAAVTAGERFGPAKSVADRFAAWKEQPKIERQVAVGRHLGKKGFNLPTYATRKGEGVE